jgi:basic amino acid/polyamine antiporter, APA family
VIGSGIFRTPNVAAGIAGATGIIFIAFLVAGLLVLLGALCFAELGTMLPKTGGYYVYLREAYGDLPAFLLGWSAFLMMNGAAMAAVASFFGELGASLFGQTLTPLWTVELPGADWVGPPLAVSLLAAAAIGLLGFTNILGVRLAGRVQVGFAAFKVSALIAVIVVGIYLGRGDPISLTPVMPREWNLSTLQIIGLVMIPALFTYDGWVNANTVAEEIQDVEKTLPRAIVMAIFLIITVYLVANFAYLWALGLEGVATSERRVAADVFEAAFGNAFQIGSYEIAPAAVITFVIFISLFGSLNGMSLSYPRMYYAMARSGVFFRAFSFTHPRFKTPYLAIALQMVWVTVLVFSGTFELLAQLVVFASFIFYALTAAALIVLRIRRPNARRPFRVPFYPFTPGIFIVGALAVVLNLTLDQPVFAGFAFLLILLGIPFYYLFRTLAQRGAIPTEDAEAGRGAP